MSGRKAPVPVVSCHSGKYVCACDVSRASPGVIVQVQSQFQ